MKPPSPNAIRAFTDYLDLGPERSFEKLLALYQERAQSAPTNRLATLKKWSSDYDWQGQLRAFEEEQREQRKAQILSSGFALTENRVELLEELTAKLRDEVRGGAIWLKDKKSIRTGSTPILSDDGERVIGSEPTYEVYEIERFNPALIEQLRGLLEDNAKETGGRVQKAEVSGPNGGAIVIERVLFSDDDDPSAA